MKYKYLIDFTALALLYACVFFKKWKNKGKDILLVNTLMYLYLSLCTYESGAVYRRFHEERGFFQAGDIKHYHDHTVWFSVSVNPKQNGKIQPNDILLFFDEPGY